MQHWTDKHIEYIPMLEKWVAYDEAGLVYDYYESKDDARDALVIYAALVLHGEAG